MRIDCHAHVNFLGYDAAKMIAHYDALGIDKAWVLTWELVNGLEWGYQHLSFQEMWEACKRYPDRLVPFHAPDPRRPDAERVLRDAIKKGLKGFGECKLRMRLDDPDLVKLFRIAGDAGLPVLIHMTKAMPPDFTYWHNHDIEALDCVLEMLPHVNFIGHGPGFWRYISGDEAATTNHYPGGRVKPGGKLVKFLERHKNLYCDLSSGSGLAAISRDPSFGKRFLVRYSNRILYGTDQFDRAHLDYLESLKLTRRVTERIMGGNATSLLPR